MLAGDIQSRRGSATMGLSRVYPSVFGWTEECSLRRRLGCEVEKRQVEVDCRKKSVSNSQKGSAKTIMSVIVVEVGEGVGMEGQGLAWMYLASTASRAWPRKSTCSAGWGIGNGMETLAGSKHWRTKTGKGRCAAQYPAVGLECVGTCGTRGGWGPGDRQSID